MAVNKITLKKVVVGTPIKTVTAGSFGIQNLGGVTTTGQVSGSILAFNQSTGNYEIANFTGDSNMIVVVLLIHFNLILQMILFLVT